MALSLEVMDRAGHDFTAQVEVRQEEGTYSWRAFLWDSGHVVDSVNGSSLSEDLIEADVKTVVSEHTFHWHGKNRGH
jgi:hypothetical protein